LVTVRDHVRFLLNDRLVRLTSLRPDQTLLDFLRLDQGLTGSKEGCAEGDCGACTVLVGQLRDGRLDLLPVNACLILLPMVDGRLIVTAEGLAEGDKLHAVQQAMVDHHGSQCGFCTPGIDKEL